MATNVLALINDMLYDCGADVVTTLGNNRQGLVASRCLRDAIVNVCSHSSWAWMKRIISAESWDGEVATISPDAVEMSMVRVGVRPLEFVSDHDFYGGHYPLGSYAANTSGLPKYYCRVGHRQYAFNPYPLDDTDRAAIKFHVRMLPSITLADDFEPDIPEDVLILIRYYASGLLAMKLTGESNISMNFMQLYENNLRQVTARYSFENKGNQSAIW
jgi:hypothetical protein